MISTAISNSAAFDDCVISPVCSRKSGRFSRRLIFSIASFSVPVTSWFAALLKPIWLSLICTKLKLPEAAPPDLSAANSLDVGIPPTIVHTRPVPAQAMQLKNPRRSMPSTGTESFGSPSTGCCDESIFFMNSPSTPANWFARKIFPARFLFVPFCVWLRRGGVGHPFQRVVMIGKELKPAEIRGLTSRRLLNFKKVLAWRNNCAFPQFSSLEESWFYWLGGGIRTTRNSRDRLSPIWLCPCCPLYTISRLG